MGAWQSSDARLADASFEAEREAAMHDARSWVGIQLRSMASWVYSSNIATEAPRSIMVGLDNAGKTSILYKLQLGESVATVPTVGFNVETISYKGHELTVWDIAGEKKVRSLWLHYTRATVGVIFVVDATDRERVPEARVELQELLSTSELNDALLLVFANKQDQPGALSARELADGLGLTTDASSASRLWHVQACSATTGMGLYPGLAWFADRVPAHWGSAATSETSGRGGGSVAEREQPWERSSCAA